MNNEFSLDRAFFEFLRYYEEGVIDEDRFALVKFITKNIQFFRRYLFN